MKKISTAFLSFISCLILISACELISNSQKETGTVGVTKKLIITADDFGASKDINEGIIQGIEAGIVNTVSAMITYHGTAEELIKLHYRYPDVGIGLHLNITSGLPLSSPENIPTLTDSDSCFYILIDLLPELEKISLVELEEELRLQIETFLKTEIPLDHFTSQNHILFIYSPFLDIIVKLAKEYQIPVRNNIPSSVLHRQFKDSPVKEYGIKIAMNFITKNPYYAAKFAKYKSSQEFLLNKSKFDNNSIPHPDNLVDAFWGSPSLERFEYIIDNLPKGSSELTLHLGIYNNQSISSKGIDSNYLPIRQKELDVILIPEVKRIIKKSSIEIIRYSDLVPN
jgi:predicted glycoside hydrolase/deacetylase ChbG (UPF0249 family)